MGTRPLTGKERVDIEKRLEGAKDQQQTLSSYIVGMERELQDGTAWCYEPEAFKRMCKEVKEEAALRRKQGEEQEIALYGRKITDAEWWSGKRPQKIALKEVNSDCKT